MWGWTSNETSNGRHLGRKLIWKVRERTRACLDIPSRRNGAPAILASKCTFWLFWRHITIKVTSRVRKNDVVRPFSQEVRHLRSIHCYRWTCLSSSTICGTTFPPSAGWGARVCWGRPSTATPVAFGVARSGCLWRQTATCSVAATAGRRPVSGKTASSARVTWAWESSWQSSSSWGMFLLSPSKPCFQGGSPSLLSWIGSISAATSARSTWFSIQSSWVARHKLWKSTRTSGVRRGSITGEQCATKAVLGLSGW